MRNRMPYIQLIIVVVCLTIGLSMINIVSILTYKRSIEFLLTNEAYIFAQLYSELGRLQSIEKPPYIVVTSSPNLDTYKIVEMVADKYIAYDMGYVNDKVRRLSLSLFLWESILIILLIAVFHKTVVKYIEHIQRVKDYMEIILLTISHKLGNFLSIQQLNINLLKKRYDKKAVYRLEQAHLIMEYDFQHTIKLLEKIQRGFMLDTEQEKINLKQIIEKIVHTFRHNFPNKNVFLNLKDTYVYVNKIDLENALFAIIENAFRYSKTKLYIKTCKSNDSVIVAIKNDVSATSRGSGLGLSLANRLVKPYGGEVTYRLKKNFLTLLILSL